MRKAGGEFSRYGDWKIGIPGTSLVACNGDAYIRNVILRAAISHFNSALAIAMAMIPMYVFVNMMELLGLV